MDCEYRWEYFSKKCYKTYNLELYFYGLNIIT